MKRKAMLSLSCVLLLAAALGGLALAQSGGSYDVEWFTIGTAGEEFVAGGAYQVGFTLGQDQEPPVSSGGPYQVVQGYRQEGGSPTAVKLVAFGVEARGQALVVYWETAAEIDTLGFHLYRSESGAPGTFARLNKALIRSQSPGGEAGAYYEWADATAVRGQRYYYVLEDVDARGQTTAHGPVDGRWPYATVFLPLIVKGP